MLAVIKDDQHPPVAQEVDETGGRVLQADRKPECGSERGRDKLWIVERGRPPGAGYGHIALQASGKAAVDAAYKAGMAAGGRDDGPPGPRPRYGPRYYAAYMLDPDGLRVEVVSRR